MKEGLDFDFPCASLLYIYIDIGGWLGRDFVWDFVWDLDGMGGWGLFQFGHFRFGVLTF